MSRFVLMVAALLLTPTLSAGQSVQGVWQLIERELRGGDAPGIESGAMIRPSFLFYQGNHYAYLIDNSDTVRVGIPEATDAQIVESISTLAVSAGTFEIVGSEIRYTRTFGLNPAAIQPENQPQVRNLERVTANVLETSTTNAETGAKSILRYRRVE